MRWYLRPKKSCFSLSKSISKFWCVVGFCYSRLFSCSVSTSAYSIYVCLNVCLWVFVFCCGLNKYKKMCVKIIIIKTCCCFTVNTLLSHTLRLSRLWCIGLTLWRRFFFSSISMSNLKFILNNFKNIIFDTKSRIEIWVNRLPFGWVTHSYGVVYINKYIYM